LLTLLKKWQRSSNRLDDLKKLYDDRKWQRWYSSFHNKKVPPYTIVNGLPVHFDPKWKRIGISFSGGADSSLLLYILCKLIKDTNSNCKIYPISLIRFHNEKPWLEHMARDVYSWIDAQYPNILQEQQWGFIPPFLETVKIAQLNVPELNKKFNADLASCDVAVVDSFIHYQVNKLKLEYVYTGNTTNPPIDHEKSPAFRQPEVMANNLNRVLSVVHISPFALINKAWIMAQYKNFSLIETLLPLTRSCEHSLSEYGLDNWLLGDKYPEPCGECFFCKEREWGWKNAGEYIHE
jgi:hypothetical protein